MDVPSVDSRLLDPRATWRDPQAYDEQARRLAQMFVENFEQFVTSVGADVAGAGPKA
jgi:phosphoenolpyruvate carboxykinase (ATP)